MNREALFRVWSSGNSVRKSGTMHTAIYAPVFVRPTETFIYNAATGLAAHKDMQVSVIAAARDTAQACPFEPVFIVPRPGRFDPRRLLRRAFRPILGMPPGGEQEHMHRKALKQALIKSKAEVILANYGPSGVLLAPVAKQLGLPMIVSFHGVDASSLALNPDWQQRYREMFLHAAAVTGPSIYVRDKLIQLGCPADRAHVLHYGIKTEQIRFSPPAKRFDGKELSFLFVGRLAEKKDPVTLLRCFASARESLLPLKAVLTIAGDGPLRSVVEREIAALGLMNHVRLLGLRTHQEVIELYKTAHIYVQHSVTAPDGDEEGLPVSITEALAAGLPVISTRHSGIPEAVIQGKTGELVNEKDIQGMADAMISMARSPDKWDEYGSAGRALLESDFSVPVVQKKLRAILKVGN